jgi:hypothetical protein
MLLLEIEPDCVMFERIGWRDASPEAAPVIIFSHGSGMRWESRRRRWR